MKAELEALERVRAANPVPDDDQVGGPDLTALFATVEERRSTMSTGMRERTRTEEKGPRPRVVAVGVFAAALLVVIVAVGVIPLLVGSDDEIVPVEQTTTVRPTTTVIESVVETSLFEWSDPVVIPWLQRDNPYTPPGELWGVGSSGIEVVEGPGGFLAHVAQPGDRRLVRIGGEWQWRESESLALSSDGMNWDPVANANVSGAVTATDSGFMVLGAGGFYPDVAWPSYRSADGRSWDEIDLAPAISELNLVPGLDDRVLVGGFGVRGVTHGDAGYVAVGSVPFATEWHGWSDWTDWYGVIAHSPDGREWTMFRGEPYGLGSIDLSRFEVTEWDEFVQMTRLKSGKGGVSVSVEDVVYGPGGYVAVGFQGSPPVGTMVSEPTDVEAVVWLSPDGTAWERIESQAGFEGREIRTVVYGPGGYVALGDGLWASVDGRTWQLVGEDIQGSSLAAGTEGYVGIGTSGEVWYSSDGTAWTELTDADLPDGLVNGVSMFDDRILLIGEVEVDGIPTTALWWGTVND